MTPAKGSFVENTALQSGLGTHLSWAQVTPGVTNHSASPIIHSTTHTGIAPELGCPLNSCAHTLWEVAWVGGTGTTQTLVGGDTGTTQTLVGSRWHTERRTCFLGCPCSCPVIGAAEQLPGVSRSVRAGLLGGGEAAAWSQLGLV